MAYTHFSNISADTYSIGQTGSERLLTTPIRWSSITTTATPASGSCGVQFVFNDPDGTAMATVCAGQFYLSESADGTTVDAADTSVAVLTNGVVTIIDTGAAKYYNYVTTAVGLLGITITAAADDYYVCFVNPDGNLTISSVCTVSA